MALHDRILNLSQLAKACHCSKPNISNAVKRGQLKCEMDGKNAMFKLDDPMTKAFIRQVESTKGIKFDLSLAFEFSNKSVGRPLKKVEIDEPAPDKPKSITEASAAGSTDDDQEYKDWRNEKAKHDCRRSELTAQKQEMENEKLAGKLLPVDTVEHILTFIIRTFSSDQLSANMNALGLIVRELGGTDDDFKRYAGHLRSTLSESAKDSVLKITDSIAGAVEDYVLQSKIV